MLLAQAIAEFCDGLAFRPKTEPADETVGGVVAGGPDPGFGAFGLEEGFVGVDGCAVYGVAVVEEAHDFGIAFKGDEVCAVAWVAGGEGQVWCLQHIPPYHKTL